MQRSWQTLARVESKSRLYLALIGRELNVSKLEPIFDRSGRVFKGYSRPYVETTLKKMAKEGTVKTKLVTQEGKRPVITYSANLQAYSEFLEDCVDADKSELKAAGEVVLSFAPLLNKFAVSDVGTPVDAILDISCAGAFPTSLGARFSEKKFAKELKMTFDVREGAFLKKFVAKLYVADSVLYVVLLEKLSSWPILLKKEVIEEAKDCRHIFANALVAYTFLMALSGRWWRMPKPLVGWK